MAKPFAQMAPGGSEGGAGLILATLGWPLFAAVMLAGLCSVVIPGVSFRASLVAVGMISVVALMPVLGPSEEQR